MCHMGLFPTFDVEVTWISSRATRSVSVYKCANDVLKGHQAECSKLFDVPVEKCKHLSQTK